MDVIAARHAHHQRRHRHRPAHQHPIIYTATALGVDGNRGWRTCRTENGFDDTYGTPDWPQSDGDIAVSGDEQCVATTYNRSNARNIVALPKQVTTTALPCGTSPTSCR